MSEKETVYPEIVIIEEPEKIKLLTDPIKKAILYLLRGKTLTARQITEELKKTALFDSKNITVQKINYHLKLLENAGLVKISKEEPIPNRPHMTTRYYTRVAPLYLVRYTPDSTKMEISSKFDKDTFKRLLHSFGYKLSDDEINTLLVKVVEFERLLYDEFINFSKKQIQPSGVNPSVLAKFFKTFGLIFSMNNEKVISLVKEIKSMLDNSIKNSN
ncbi:MAG: hypothetical protein ACP6IU_04630 [Candidatus Asgardarchaeia archaeon]